MSQTTTKPTATAAKETTAAPSLVNTLKGFVSRGSIAMGSNSIHFPSPLHKGTNPFGDVNAPRNVVRRPTPITKVRST